MALFLRGFKLSDIEKQVFVQDLKTPSMNVWLVEVPDYSNKMTAYKAGVAAAQTGLGVYVIKTDNHWRWVGGVYTASNHAESTINRISSLSNLSIREYRIESKNFRVSRDVMQPCQDILDCVVRTFEMLLNLRDYIDKSLSTDNLLMSLTKEYNDIKNNTQRLHDLNVTLKSPLIASIIYTANQNILGLQEIVCGNNSYSLADVNTALLKTFFSLDNF